MTEFRPQSGDLLFQQQETAPIDTVISQTFVGYWGYRFNHVALYAGDDRVIEAIAPTVRTTALKDFLSAATDAGGQPRVLVFRLLEAYAGLVEGAIAHARTLVGLPYNHDFSDSKTAYYCSELIVDSFKVANNGQSFFPETPMSFKDPTTGDFFPYWLNYYHQLGKPIPEGKPGSHPALLSRSEKITLVHQYGKFME